MMTTCLSLIVGGGGGCAKETKQEKRIEPGHVGRSRVHFPNGGADAGDSGQQRQARLRRRPRQPSRPRQRGEIEQKKRRREIGLADERRPEEPDDPRGLSPQSERAAAVASEI